VMSIVAMSQPPPSVQGLIMTLSALRSAMSR
jgi:hypothetical protein